MKIEEGATSILRDTVWNYMYLWQVNFFYYRRLCHMLGRLNSLLKFGSALITTIAIAGWGYWPNHFVIWTAVALLSQIASLIAECTDLSVKYVRLNFWTEDAQKIVNSITALWDEIDELSDSEVRSRLQGLQDKWSILDARFLQDITPDCKRNLKLAEEEARNFLNVVHIANHDANAESQEEVTQ